MISGRSFRIKTTHNIALLQEKDLLRKDDIWFTEKQEDGSTDLYSMADFHIRKGLSYFKAYNTGNNATTVDHKALIFLLLRLNKKKVREC